MSSEETSQDAVEAASAPGMKRCRDCGEDKPLDAYHRNYGTHDRHLSCCKDCVNAKARAIWRRKAAWPQARYERNATKARGSAGLPVAEGMKWCTGCGEQLPIAEFFRNHGTRDGHVYQCKTCTRARVRARRQGQTAGSFGPLPRDPAERDAEKRRRCRVVRADRKAVVAAASLPIAVDGDGYNGARAERDVRTYRCHSTVQGGDDG